MRYEIGLSCILIVLLVGLGIFAGYKIRGVENKMDCGRDNTVVIHKGVRR